MKHGIGLQTSIWNNNLKSTFLLVSFPFLISIMIWTLIFAAHLAVDSPPVPTTTPLPIDESIHGANQIMMKYWWIIFSTVGGWFVIAWFSHQSIINKETKARPLERKENPGVYNVLENLCISRGITMPKLFIIDSDALNAYASGINEKTYAITLTSGLIEKLKEDELEAVIAHELSHIINRDVRLLIISIIFVGIISIISEMMVRGIFRRSNRDSNGGASKGKFIGIIIILLIAAFGYLLSILIRFAISRRREYLADAGSVELTKNSDALIRALQKISGNSNMENVDNDVKQMMFDNQSAFIGLFATHPTIESRIEVLKNY